MRARKQHKKRKMTADDFKLAKKLQAQGSLAVDAARAMNISQSTACRMFRCKSFEQYKAQVRALHGRPSQELASEEELQELFGPSNIADVENEYLDMHFEILNGRIDRLNETHSSYFEDIKGWVQELTDNQNQIIELLTKKPEAKKGFFKRG